VGIFTKASIKKMKEKATGRCTGLMVVATKGNGLREFNMDMEE